MVFKKPYRDFGIVFALSFLTLEAFYPVLPYVVATMHVTKAQAQGLVNAYLGVAMLTEFIMPLVLSLVSKKKVYYFIWLLGFFVNLGCLYISQFNYLYLTRILIGISTGGLAVLTRLQIEMTQKDMANGFHFSVGAILGYHAVIAILAPTLAAWLINSFGWQAVGGLCALGYVMIAQIFLSWYQRSSLPTLTLKVCQSNMLYMLQDTRIIKQCLLTGMIVSLPMCETIFSGFYLTMHFHWSLLTFGFYVSTIKLTDVMIRLYLPYILVNKDKYVFSVSTMIFSFVLFFLLMALKYDQLTFYLSGCVLLNIASNIMLVYLSVDMFKEVAYKHPMVGTAIFGSLQFGCSFAASSILVIFTRWSLFGFLLYVSLNVFLFLLFVNYKAKYVSKLSQGVI